MNWDQATNVILCASFAVLAVFVILGLYQWIKQRSLKKVDRELLWAPLPLALMAAVYVIFDKFIVLNVRPNGSGESSFPSTHVMVVATIFFLTFLILPKYIHKKSARIALEIAMLILLFLVCIGRVLSDMHWPIDVVGGLVFAFIFTEIYYLIIKKGAKNAQHLHQNH